MALLLLFPVVATASPLPPNVAPPPPVAAAETPGIVQPAAVLGLIDAAIAERRFGSANVLIARALPQSDGPELQLRIAELALASGDRPAAALAFSALTAEPVVAARALQGLGITRLQQANLPAAVAALDAALAQDPGLGRAWNARAVIADRQRDWLRADTAYARAIAIDPQSAAVLTNRGYSLILRARYAEAEADLARALVIEPANDTARTNLRFARAMQGHYTEAFAGSTRETLATDLNTVGFAAMSRGDVATAEAYFSRALALNKQFDRTAWDNLEYLRAQRDAAAAPAQRPDGRSSALAGQ